MREQTSLPPLPQRYAGVQVLLHWLVVGLLLVVFAWSPSGWLAANDMPHWVHELAGKLILALMLLRLWIRLRIGVPTPMPGHRTWQHWAAKVTHWAFYGILLLYPLSGWVFASIDGDTRLGSLPLWLLPEMLAEPAYRLHLALKPLLIILIVLHALAALYHSLWYRDGTWRRMSFRS